MRLVRWIIGSLLATIVVSLSAMPPASATLCAGWEKPKTAAVGSRVSIDFRTYVPISADGGYSLKPYAVPDYPFDVSVVAPDGRAIRVEVRPNDAQPTEWSGSFTADRPGSWKLRILNLAGSDPECYSDAVLLVAERRGIGIPYLAIGTAAIAMGGIAAFALARRLRERRAPLD